MAKMTRDDIIAMAQKAYGDWYPNAVPPELERFAALVAAAEREKCAKVCEDIPLPQGSTELTHLPTIERCAAAIRARGEE